MTIQTQVQKIAVRTFLALLPVSADDNGTFRVMLTAKLGEEEKPLLIVGTAHSRVEDGSCIAVLNPDLELAAKISGGWGSTPGLFKKLVTKRCDFAIILWIEAYKNNRVVVGGKYTNQTPAPAKFVVR